jgi:1-acyl-sn-glycerol-3-phosphate acyltransferase
MSFAGSAFDAVFYPWMRTRLHVHTAGPAGDLPTGVPLLYCANHQSWWDGFLLRHLHRTIRPRAPYRAVMLQSELSRRPFLRHLGALGLEAGSLASGRRLLRALSRARRDVGVAYFPQGRIMPDSPCPLGFRPGVRNVARALAPAVVVPVALHIVPGTQARMDAYVSVGRPLSVTRTEVPAVPDLEAAVGEELDAIRAFVRRFGEDSIPFSRN